MAKEVICDMTKGSPMKHIIIFSIPLILGNLFQVFYNMVDSIIVGRTLGVEALAGVGVAGSLHFLVIGFSSGITSGFGIIVAQRFGANDPEGVRRSVAMGTVLNLCFSILLTSVSVGFTMPILKWMHTPADIIQNAYDYIVVIFMGISATMFFNYLSCIIRALGDSKTPLYFLMIASATNIILDFVFILFFHMGTAGAGLATVIAQALSGLLCLLLIVKKFPMLHVKRKHWRWDSRFAWIHLRLGLPMALQFSITASGVMIVQSVLNGFGSTIVAGYTAANKIEQLITQPLIAFGVTMATYIGQNYGAGNAERIKQGTKSCMLLVTLFSVFGSLLIFFFGSGFTKIFVGNGQTDVIAAARTYLVITCFFYLILGYLIMFRNTLQGMNNSIVSLLGSGTELISRIIFAILLSKYLGYAGVCFASPFAWTTAGILYIVQFIFDIKKFKKQLAKRYTQPQHPDKKMTADAH